MPVTPAQARKLAKEREELLERVDQAILAAYMKGPLAPAAVEVTISPDQYRNEALIKWLEAQYTQAGWSVHFDQMDGDQMDGDGYINFVLTERQKKP